MPPSCARKHRATPTRVAKARAGQPLVAGRARCLTAAKHGKQVATGAVADAPTSNAQHATKFDEIDWRKQWYAVRPVVDLRADRPTADTILGKDVVVWHDGEGWRVFEDACPHRKVALSEGRIESDGTLSCAYHGWRFNGQGACTRIPQLEGEPEYVQRVMARPAACVAQFPTRVQDGMLFVWMSSGPEAEEDARATPIPSGPPPAMSDAEHMTVWYTRDMPMSIEVLLENFSDPSHPPFSHHGTGPNSNRYKPRVPVFERAELQGTAGFAAYDKTQIVQWDATGLQTISEVSDSPPGKVRSKIWMYSTPLTRMTARTSLRVFINREPPLLLRMMPKWFRHRATSRFLEGDAVFLHRQAVELQSRGRHHSSYFQPAKADLPISTLWKVLTQHSPGGVNYYPHTCDLNELPKEKVLDRYTQHVKDCHACRGALEKLVALQWAALCGGVLAAVGFLARLLGPAATAAWATAGWGALAVLGIAGFLGLRALEKEFFFVNYVHQDVE